MAMMLDGREAPNCRDDRTRSRDWGEVAEFCKAVYMPYRVQPLERFCHPYALMLSAKIGRVTMTRFRYGTAIHLDRFDPAAGNILVLNTLSGGLRHRGDDEPVVTRAGESFVVDCSRADYWLDGDVDHLQLNLTVSHRTMEDTAERWFGFVPDDRLWGRRVKFGGAHSRWQVLLDYAARTVCADLPMPPDGVFGRHLEEMICLDLLREWADGAGVRLDRGGGGVAPHYVRRAEEILRQEAREAPTVADVSRRIGISARTLSEGFRRFRGVSPRAFLAARRLEGLHADLCSAPPHLTVADIAVDWGYVNFGALAGAYRRRFGELPSKTRNRVRAGN